MKITLGPLFRVAITRLLTRPPRHRRNCPSVIGLSKLPRPTSRNWDPVSLGHLERSDLGDLSQLLFVHGIPVFRRLHSSFLVQLTPIVSRICFSTNCAVVARKRRKQSVCVIIRKRIDIRLNKRRMTRFGGNSYFKRVSIFSTRPQSTSIAALRPYGYLILARRRLCSTVSRAPNVTIGVVHLLSHHVHRLGRSLGNMGHHLRTTGGRRSGDVVTPAVPTCQPRRNCTIPT